jgi:hypothetical protein
MNTFRKETNVEIDKKVDEDTNIDDRQQYK